jgi:hypothetical protein
MLSPSRSRLLTTVMAAACLALGCDRGLPPAGPDDTAGIDIFEHAGYSGRSGHLAADVSNLTNFAEDCHWTCSEEPGGYYSCSSTWNDCISSITVTPGWRATVYVDIGYRGASQELTANVPDLGQLAGPCNGTWNDCISSIRVSQAPPR